MLGRAERVRTIDRILEYVQCDGYEMVTDAGLSFSTGLSYRFDIFLFFVRNVCVAYHVGRIDTGVRRRLPRTLCNRTLWTEKNHRKPVRKRANSKINDNCIVRLRPRIRSELTSVLIARSTMKTATGT